MELKRALILVDIQNDFLEGGSFPAPQANEVIPVALKLMKEHNGFFHKIIATQDWHPENHSSFVSLWPKHCVQNSKGAELAPEILECEHLINKIVFKGTDTQIDSYSGFRDNLGDRETDLRAYLEDEKITDVYIMGLVSDYCVALTAADARKIGFETFLITDGSRGIDAERVQRVYEELTTPDEHGRKVTLVTSSTIA